MSRILGKKKLINDISANTLQTGITQVFGLTIFYFTSKYLSKDDFGEFNWSMAVGATVIAIASLGLDLVFVKKIAAGEDVVVMSGIHFFHTVIVGLFLGAAIFLIRTFVPSFTASHPLFLLVFINLALANIANSFKLCLNGLESYRQLAIMALCTNLFKFLGIILLYFFGEFSIYFVIFVYIATSFIELTIGYFMMSRKLAMQLKPVMRIIEYKYFILESLPQLGVVLFDSALARIDWILLGVISTVAITAEYSFAYRIFELSKLPLLIIAPVLLTRFSKLFKNDGVITDQRRDEIGIFLRIEMYVMMLIPIILVSCWGPLIDYFTDGKYGKVNELNYYLLAPCVPLACLINFLWTLGFVQGQLKVIMYITIGVSLLNVVFNALLIPFYGAQGASVAFLFSTIMQLFLYLRFIRQDKIILNIGNCVLAFVNASVAVLTAKICSNNVIFTSLIAVLIHFCLTFITGQVTLAQVKQVFRSVD